MNLLRAIRLSIGQALSNGALNRAAGAFGIVNFEGSAVRMPEIEFGQIPMQMVLVAVLINAGHPALEH